MSVLFVRDNIFSPDFVFSLITISLRKYFIVSHDLRIFSRYIYNVKATEYDIISIV